MRRFAVPVFAAIFFLSWVAFLWSGLVTNAAAQSQPASSSDNPTAETKSAPTTHTLARHNTAKKKSAAVTSSKKHKTVSPHVRRVRQAFVASASLRPMAQQLLQDRTPTAYAGVEEYARRHPKEDAGALAWLAVGYAHTLDRDYAGARGTRSDPAWGQLPASELAGCLSAVRQYI